MQHTATQVVSRDRRWMCHVVAMITVRGAEANEHVGYEKDVEYYINDAVICPAGLLKDNNERCVRSGVNDAEHQERVPPRDGGALLIEDAAAMAVKGLLDERATRQRYASVAHVVTYCRGKRWARRRVVVRSQVATLQRGGFAPARAHLASRRAGRFSRKASSCSLVARAIIAACGLSARAFSLAASTGSHDGAFDLACGAASSESAMWPPAPCRSTNARSVQISGSAARLARRAYPGVCPRVSAAW